MFRGKAGPNKLMSFTSLLRQYPSAEAFIKGSDDYLQIKGFVRSYQTKYGVLVVAEISGLPTPKTLCKDHSVFAFHIHEGNNCSGNKDDPFAGAMSHYDKDNCNHPYHDGDMPSLFANNNGYAFQIFLTDRFSICEVIEKTIIIHRNQDDFTTQPSGNAGSKIACGKIKSCKTCKAKN